MSLEEAELVAYVFDSIEVTNYSCRSWTSCNYTNDAKSETTKDYVSLLIIGSLLAH